MGNLGKVQGLCVNIKKAIGAWRCPSQTNLFSIIHVLSIHKYKKVERIK